MSGGGQSEVGRLRRVLLKHARDAFGGPRDVEARWREEGYSAPPDTARAAEEYDRFVATLERCGVDVAFAPPDPDVGLDSIYVRDAAVVCERGAILGNMGKPSRRAEPRALEPALREAGLPVVGSIQGTGRLEGGDVVWLDARTLAVGRGYRTNDEGITQLRALIGECAGEILEVPLPHHRGPEDVFHLMSILSPVDEDLAVVYSPLMPVRFREELLARRIRLVEVPDAEFESMACNVLAVAPRCCVMLEGNPRTRALLERAGAEVHEYSGSEISAKGAGGPTCLTRPLERG